jgi:hypothetical protein
VINRSPFDDSVTAKYSGAVAYHSIKWQNSHNKVIGVENLYCLQLIGFALPLARLTNNFKMRV